MKRILITGQNSYIGNWVEKYLQEYSSLTDDRCYFVDKISQRDESWKRIDFSEYDTVLDVTGIAHADIEKISEGEKQKYYDINCNLAVETAKKAREDGVKQFIYLSSIIVYGENAPIGKQKNITRETIPEPANFYGDSKWQAEQQLGLLETEGFAVAILRLPFVYGYGSKGNYQVLSKLAQKLPVFPTIRNRRSMIYIENLCEFLRLLTESGRGGVWFPQNAEYGVTAEIVKEIAKVQNKKIWMCGIFNLFVKMIQIFPGKAGRLVNKAFGSITYDASISNDMEGYQIYSFTESIQRTERVADS